MLFRRVSSFGVFTLGAVGLLLWFVANLIGFGLGAGGDGWGTSFIVSIPLLILYPTILIRTFHPHNRALWPDICLTVIALALDGLLLRNFFVEDYEYFSKIWIFSAFELAVEFIPFVAIWLVLWTGWQALLFAGLFKKRHLIKQTEATSYSHESSGWLDRLLALLVIVGLTGILLIIIDVILSLLGWLR